jgi:hypothetical protein
MPLVSTKGEKSSHFRTFWPEFPLPTFDEVQYLNIF